MRLLTVKPRLLLASAQEAGLLSAADTGQLLRFHADPAGTDGSELLFQGTCVLMARWPAICDTCFGQSACLPLLSCGTPG